MLYNQRMTSCVENSVSSFFERANIPQNAVIGVALSGGRDSVALFHALLKLNKNIVAINVEHGIRGEESVKDSLFVKELCEKCGVRLFAYSVDAPAFCKQNGYTLEQGARMLRYEIFDKLLEEGKCDYVALAHHLDDQAETVFMRILRGTGVKGLQGMKEVSGEYIRPLLDCDREDIDRYVQDISAKYVDDETNFCADYTRNFLRQELERLKERFPSLLDSVARLTRNASETQDFIQSKMHPLSLENGEVRIAICDLQEPVLAKEYIVQGARLLGEGQDVEERHFPLVFALCAAENGKRIELAHGIVCHKDGDFLVMSKTKSSKKTQELPFDIKEYDVFGVAVTKSCLGEFENAQKGGGTLFIDGDKVPCGAVVRTRREGDYIDKFGGGRKSLGDFLTDKKVPLRVRDELAVLAIGSQVLAVFGVEISKTVKIDGGENVLKLTLSETKTHH